MIDEEEENAGPKQNNRTPDRPHTWGPVMMRSMPLEKDWQWSEAGAHKRCLLEESRNRHAAIMKITNAYKELTNW